MQLKNTRFDYGVIAKTIHWLTALCFLGAYIAVYYRHWFTESRTPENWTALQTHLSFGISAGVLIVLRIIWTRMNVKPDPEPGTKTEHTAAKLGHWALYGVMILMPLTGYIGTGVNTEYFGLFDISKFEDTPLFQWIGTKFSLSFKAFEEPIDFIHKDVMGALIVWILIVGHIGAALYHHFVKKDRTLKKMLPGTE